MYGKHFKSMYTGSMMGAGLHVFAVWGYVIAHHCNGSVELNEGLMAYQLGCDVANVKEAIKFLCAPDAASRSPVNDGRRLIHEGGFRYAVVNGEAYRAIRHEDDRRAYDRDRKRLYRAGLKSTAVQQDVPDSPGKSEMSAHTEAEAEADTEKAKDKDAAPPTGVQCASPPPATMHEPTADDAKEVASPPERINGSGYHLPACPYRELVDLYHRRLPMLSRVEVLSDQRKRHLQARWRQVCADGKLDRTAGIEWFDDFFFHVGRSAFLTGRSKPRDGKRPFAASLDWLMGAEKFVKVFEGKYHDAQELRAQSR